jgi:Tfp pilus assembly protein FimT
MEILIVVALLGIILALTISAFSRYLQEYRLSVVTRQLGSAISLTRLKAVSTNMQYSFTLQSDVDPNQYQASGTNDLDDPSSPNHGTLQPWEDVMGTGTIVVDKIYSTPQKIANTDHPVIDHQGISTLPNGAAMTDATDNGTVLSIVFDGQGIRKSMKDNSNINKQYVLIQSQGFTQAVFVDPTGLVRLYKYSGPGWTELQ